MTVYGQFGNRDAVREAVYDQFAQTGGLVATPSIFAEPDPIYGIGRLIDIFYGFCAAHRLVLRRLNALAGLAAADGQRPPDRNRRRRHILTVLLSGAAQLPEYRGLDVESTARMLQALTKFEFNDRLADEVTGTGPARHILQRASAVL